VAENLAITPQPSIGLPPYPTGLAVAADGTIYMAADANNAVYRIRPQR
jgi:glucose/arabinose dehydrogenase